MDRRTLLTRIAAAAGAAYWSGQTLAVELAQAAGARTEAPAKVEKLDAGLAATLAALCELIIPATDTPGAVEAGVPAFVGDMYAHWMTPAERKVIADGLAALDAAGFAKAAPEQQSGLFRAAQATAKGYQGPRALAARIADPNAPFFFKMRDLVTLGYFTSELGVTKELAYIPVPGKFEGDVDINTWNKQMQL